jgi:hypothetical protein
VVNKKKSLKISSISIICGCTKINMLIQMTTNICQSAFSNYI